MRFSKLAILALVLVPVISQAQTSCLAMVKCANESPSERNRDDGASDYYIAFRGGCSSRTAAGLAFLRRMNSRLIKQFEKAWAISADGTSAIEGVVLIFRMEDGSYRGNSLGVTHEYHEFTFKWDPAALAIVHTHPNHCDPKPSEHDQRVADEFDVPIFTITISGMYVYDPATKITSKLLDGVDWLKPSKWTPDVHRNLIAGLAAECNAPPPHSFTISKAKPRVNASASKYLSKVQIPPATK